MGDYLWAWQNPDITKKIAEDERVEQPKKVRKPSRSKKPRDSEDPESAASDQGRLRRKRPIPTLNRSLTTLRLLLRSSSFDRLHLAVHFFSCDIYEAWLKHDKEASSKVQSEPSDPLNVEPLTERIHVAKQPTSPLADQKREFAPSDNSGVHDINVTYSELKTHIEKSVSLLGEQRIGTCSVCMGHVDLQGSTVMTCPLEGCRAMSHMTCLSKTGARDRPSGDSLLPVSIRCPKCHKEYQWVDLVRELSLRIRGESSLAQLMKVPRKRKAKAVEDLSSRKVRHAVGGGRKAAEYNQNLDNAMTADDILSMDIEDDPLPDNWHELGEDSDDQSVTSTDTRVSSCPGSPIRSRKQQRQLPVVIEDSEWDPAEVLD
ncbi:MAG: hypothetical protein Q9170_007528 [Blastenia crenularia]